MFIIVDHYIVTLSVFLNDSLSWVSAAPFSYRFHFVPNVSFSTLSLSVSQYVFAGEVNFLQAIYCWVLIICLQLVFFLQSFSGYRWEGKDTCKLFKDIFALSKVPFSSLCPSLPCHLCPLSLPISVSSYPCLSPSLSDSVTHYLSVSLPLHSSTLLLSFLPTFSSFLLYHFTHLRLSLSRPIPSHPTSLLLWSCSSPCRPSSPLLPSLFSEHFSL